MGEIVSNPGAVQALNNNLTSKVQREEISFNFSVAANNSDEITINRGYTYTGGYTVAGVTITTSDSTWGLFTVKTVTDTTITLVLRNLYSGGTIGGSGKAYVNYIHR